MGIRLVLLLLGKWVLQCRHDSGGRLIASFGLLQKWYLRYRKVMR